jgi:hypothetical protein
MTKNLVSTPPDEHQHKATSGWQREYYQGFRRLAILTAEKEQKKPD